MSSRRLLILAIVALIAIGAGVWLAGRQSSGSSEAYGALYPGLAKALDAVTAVRIYKSGDTPAVELVRGSGSPAAWTVAQRAGYPADEAKLRTLLRSLADAKVYEEKTSLPEQYKALGVEDLGATDATGVRIELAGAPQPVSLIVGKPGAGAQSTYVRRAGEPQSWLVNVSIDTSSSPDAWLRKEILDVSADRIQSASVDTRSARPYTAAKSSRADADFKLEGLPKGKKPGSPSAANGFATALSNLTLADVQSAAAFDGGKPADHATFKTFDGLVVELDGWTREDKHYLAVRTSFDAAQADRYKIPTAAADATKDEKGSAGPAGGQAATAPAAATADTAASGAKGDASAAQASATSQDATSQRERTQDAAAAPARGHDVQAEAREAQAKLTDWIYEIPAYKYEAIFKPVEELL